MKEKQPVIDEFMDIMLFHLGMIGKINWKKVEAVYGRETAERLQREIACVQGKE